jgi:3-deoxy-7-phosphoheptulonate synthase
LSNEVGDQFLLIMRAYFEKPRTQLGWKGLLYDPSLDGSHDIASGLVLTRRLLLDLAELEIPAAAEFLDPVSSVYFDDLISWGCIGARTSTSQTHRQMSSGLTIPIGFKNTTDGNVAAAVNGIVSCAQAHSFMGISQPGKVGVVRTRGNPYGHLVLRGSESQTNYDPQSISEALISLQKAGLPQRLLVDCSHDNSKRDHEQQIVVFQSIIAQILEGNTAIRGLLLESHIESGKQQLGSPMLLKYAVSLTDPCIDWRTTESLIRWGHEKFKAVVLTKECEV